MLEKTRTQLKALIEGQDGPKKLITKIIDSFFHKIDDQAWDDLRFPAQGIDPTGGTSDADRDKVDSTYIGTLLFDSTSAQLIAGIAQMPHSWKEGSVIRPHIHWMPTDANTGNVVWKFSYVLANVNGVFQDSYLELTVTDAADGNANKHQITGFGEIDMTEYKLSTIMLWRITRLAANESDTYGADARLLEFDIHYQIDALGSGQEYLK